MQFNLKFGWEKHNFFFHNMNMIMSGLNIEKFSTNHSSQSLRGRQNAGGE